MKRNNPLLLVFAMATALSLAACARDETPDIDTVAAPAAEPAPVEPMPPAAPPAAPVDSGMAFAEMDKDGDGGVTQEELAESEMLYQHFSVADTDGNGQLSEAEVEQHRADMAAAPGN